MFVALYNMFHLKTGETVPIEIVCLTFREAQQAIDCARQPLDDSDWINENFLICDIGGS